VAELPRFPDVDPYCNPVGRRPAQPWEPMPSKAYLAGRRDDFQTLAFSSCFGMVRRAGSTLTRVAALGSVVAWCCPSEVF
jgi:hypothetical protein